MDDNSAFSPQNLGPVIVITLARMYDLLAVIALALNEQKAKQVLDEHSNGKFRMPEVRY